MSKRFDIPVYVSCVHFWHFDYISLSLFFYFSLFLSLSLSLSFALFVHPSLPHTHMYTLSLFALVISNCIVFPFYFSLAHIHTNICLLFLSLSVCLFFSLYLSQAQCAVMVSTYLFQQTIGMRGARTILLLG